MCIRTLLGFKFSCVNHTYELMRGNFFKICDSIYQQFPPLRLYYELTRLNWPKMAYPKNIRHSLASFFAFQKYPGCEDRVDLGA